MNNTVVSFLTGYWFTTIFLFAILLVIITPIILICLCGIRFMVSERKPEEDANEHENLESQNFWSVNTIKRAHNQVFDQDMKRFFEKSNINGPFYHSKT